MAMGTLGGVHVGGALARLVSPGSIHGGEKLGLAAVPLEMGTEEEGRGAPSRTLLAGEGDPLGPVCPALTPTVLQAVMSWANSHGWSRSARQDIWTHL